MIEFPEDNCCAGKRYTPTPEQVARDYVPTYHHRYTPRPGGAAISMHSPRRLGASARTPAGFAFSYADIQRVAKKQAAKRAAQQAQSAAYPKAAIDPNKSAAAARLDAILHLLAGGARRAHELAEALGCHASTVFVAIGILRSRGQVVAIVPKGRRYTIYMLEEDA